MESGEGLLSIRDNIREITEEIKTACLRVNRDPAAVKIVAVTKTVPVDRIREAVAAGLADLGENRVQEFQEKYPLLENVNWHIIGHLQSNKVKYIADKVSLIHSLDSLSLAETISGRMAALGKSAEVLVQVNIAREATKSGIEPGETIKFIESAAKLPGIKIKGLMTIAPFTDNRDEVRAVFRRLRTLAAEAKEIGIPGVAMDHLSMGMSNDYITAIEEGATLLRLGSIIFGQRN